MTNYSASSPPRQHVRRAGAVLGRYRLVEQIGIGGMASVHLARVDGPGGFQKWVAIKRIHRHLARDERFVRMFLDEARVAAQISHPHVAQVFELGRHEGTFWLCMEYLHGEPLRELMRVCAARTSPGFNHRLAAKLVAGVAEGLHAAHELRDPNGELVNLVHRDVSPHNIFLTYDGVAKVVDFGVAAGAGRLACTQAGTVKGKLAYMSPEQIRGRPVDRRTDVFALGVVLWELCTGRRLFAGGSDLDTLEKVRACSVPRPSRMVPGFPPELEAILLRALARDRRERFQTARGLARALERHLLHAPGLVGYQEIGEELRRLLPAHWRAREAMLRAAAAGTGRQHRFPTQSQDQAGRAPPTTSRPRPAVTPSAPGRSRIALLADRPSLPALPVADSEDAVTRIMSRPAGWAARYPLASQSPPPGALQGPLAVCHPLLRPGDAPLRRQRTVQSPVAGQNRSAAAKSRSPSHQERRPVLHQSPDRRCARPAQPPAGARPRRRLWVAAATTALAAALLALASV